MAYTALTELLKGNAYAGRGIMIGRTQDGKQAVVVYFIMGRSENSRNRVFKEEGEGITIYPFDASKVKDPSLIIYSPSARWKTGWWSPRRPDRYHLRLPFRRAEL